MNSKPLIILNVKATSSAVSGWPSCHLPPSCSLNVQTLPSALTDHSLASCGWAWLRRSVLISES